MPEQPTWSRTPAVPGCLVAARPPLTPRGMCVELGRPGLPYVFRKDELASCHSRRSASHEGRHRIRHVLHAAGVGRGAD